MDAPWLTNGCWRRRRGVTQLELLLLWVLVQGWSADVMCVCTCERVCAHPPPLLQSGVTALMRAAYNGHTEAVTLLLSKGADLETKDNVRHCLLSCPRVAILHRSPSAAAAGWVDGADGGCLQRPHGGGDAAPLQGGGAGGEGQCASLQIHTHACLDYLTIMRILTGWLDGT